ncbi:MAG: hypothetical protein OEZ04_09440 [Nitrospinota bacterium]|nr:hypothetical protein [Nitrospinota bacterium]
MNYSRKYVAIILSSVTFLLLLGNSSAEAGRVRIYEKDEGYFTTNLSGEPNLRPPFLRTIRSAKEFSLAMAEYATMKGRYDAYRLGKVKRKFRKFNYRGKMLIAIFSQPLDQFSMKVKGVKESEDGLVVVDLSYRHERLMGRKSNKKRVYYIIIAVPKSAMPVVLHAKEVKVKRRTNARLTKVTGVLMEYGDGQVQLVVEKRRRGKKSTYYVKDPDYEAIKDHFGKRVTIEGYIKPEGLSAYEWEITYDKLVKVYEPRKRGRRRK